LKEQLVGRIGCHSDGVTYVVPVSYAYDDPYVYVHTYNGMKLDMMRKNGNVVFQVDNTKNLAYWRSVICWGVFEELFDNPLKEKAFRKLQERVLPILSSETMHIARDWPFPAENEETTNGVYFRIMITKKTGRFEKVVAEEFYAT
jgi:uncharacterized protein